MRVLIGMIIIWRMFSIRCHNSHTPWSSRPPTCPWPQTSPNDCPARPSSPPPGHSYRAQTFLSSSLLYIILSRLTKSARICLHPSYLHLILSFTHLPLLSSLFSLSIVHTHPNDPFLLCPLLLSAPIPR